MANNMDLEYIPHRKVNRNKVNGQMESVLLGYNEKKEMMAMNIHSFLIT
jgi:hypothetical protein